MDKMSLLIVFSLRFVLDLRPLAKKFIVRRKDVREEAIAGSLDAAPEDYLRWIVEAQNEEVKASARCSRCGRKGATLQHPSWAGRETGNAAFPNRSPGRALSSTRDRRDSSRWRRTLRTSQRQGTS